MAKIFPSCSRLLEIHVESKHQCLTLSDQIIVELSVLLLWSRSPKWATLWVPNYSYSSSLPECTTGVTRVMITSCGLLLCLYRCKGRAPCYVPSQRIPQLLKFFRQSLSMTLASCCLEIPLSTSPTGPQCAKEACIFSEEV